MNDYTNNPTGEIDGEYAFLHRPHLGPTSTYAQLGNSGSFSEPPHVPASTCAEPTRAHTSAYAEPYAFLRTDECKGLEDDDNEYASVELKDQLADNEENEQTYFVLEVTSSDSNEDPECNLRDKEQIWST